MMDFPDGPVVKNPPSNARDMDSIPAQGRFYRATKPVHHTTGSEYHNYQSLYALEPILSNKRSAAMRSLGSATERPLTHRN